jgi:RimJ/RimL family protein N-acetyltransferase
MPDPFLILTGKYVTLQPLSSNHIPSLYAAIGGADNEDYYKHIAHGPYTDLATFTTFIEGLTSNPSCVPYAIFIPSQKEALGIIVIDPVLLHRRGEMGQIYGKGLQRSTAGTEASFLLMRYAFEQLGFLRVEWKCDAENRASRMAATRLGFVEEGTCRKHMISKGRRRDTVCFGIVDDEWGVLGRALEEWLGEGNFDGEGRQRRKLEVIRKEIEAAKRSG